AIDVDDASAAAGVGYDQVQVGNGLSILSGATLSLASTGAHPPTTDAILRIIDVTSGAPPVGNTFSGRAQGTSVSVSGFNGISNYSGGTGNDVTLETLGTFSVTADANVSEGNSGTTGRTFTITRSSGTSATGVAPIHVSYQTTDGTAAAVSDYVAAALTQLIFSP